MLSKLQVQKESPPMLKRSNLVEGEFLVIEDFSVRTLIPIHNNEETIAPCCLSQLLHSYFTIDSKICEGSAPDYQKWGCICHPSKHIIIVI